MKYCKVINDNVGLPESLPNSIGNCHNPHNLSDEKLAALDYYRYIDNPVGQYQKISRYHISGYTVEPVIEDMPDDDIWNQVRTERDKLLSACDWTQVADAPVNSEAWATYRQQLRDLPQTYDDPKIIDWPVKPE